MEQLIMEDGNKKFIQISEYIDYKFRIEHKNPKKTKIFVDYRKALNYYNRIK